MNKARLAAYALTIALFSMFFFMFLRGVLTPRVKSGQDAGSGISWEYGLDDDEWAGEKHLLWVKAWESDTGRAVAGASVEYKKKGQESLDGIELDRSRGTRIFTGTLPEGKPLDRIFYAFVLERENGARARAPAGAFEGKRPLFVVYEGRPSAFLMAAHIGFSVAGVFLAVHAFYYLVFFLLSGRAADQGRRRSVRAGYLNVLAGLVLFFIGTIPLGILANQAIYGVSWEGWPVGADVTDTKSEIVILVWAALLVWRRDLLKGAGPLKPLKDKVFAGLFFAAMAVSVASFLIPHSFFFAEKI